MYIILYLDKSLISGLPNSNGVKTLKVHNLGAVKKLTYVAPISRNPNFHMI